MPDRHPRLTRRDALRLAAGTTLALPLALETRHAAALRTWCRADPTIVIDGRIADILVAGSENAAALAAGSIRVVVTVPRGYARSAAAYEGVRADEKGGNDKDDNGSPEPGPATQLLSADNGFGRGYSVNFATSRRRIGARGDRIRVEVAIYVPATDDTMPVLLEWRPHAAGVVTASAEGTANRWLTVRTFI